MPIAQERGLPDPVHLEIGISVLHYVEVQAVKYLVQPNDPGVPL